MAVMEGNGRREHHSLATIYGTSPQPAVAIAFVRFRVGLQVAGGACDRAEVHPRASPRADSHIVESRIIFAFLNFGRLSQPSVRIFMIQRGLRLLCARVYFAM
jgi:hypothetical protein